MIRTDSEYREAVDRLAAEKLRLEQQRRMLRSQGLRASEIKRVLDPMQSFHEQLAEEVESYDRLKRGEFDELHNFEGVGRLLVALRISKGVSQRELAQRLGVHESQISRDERNEYHGITVERANRILGALEVEVRSVVAAAQ